MTEPMLDERLTLPAGTRLLHIGPPETGTTTLQAAFWAARDAAMAQGVRYAGTSRHSSRAMLAVTGGASIADEGLASPPISHWTALLDEIREAAEPRVVLSSEGFSSAGPDAIRRIVTDLDPDRVHVVVTLRPLARVLGSEWQEHAQSGLETPFEAWLENLFDRPDEKASRVFWHRQRHEALIARWAEVVGPARVTAIVVDETDHAFILRAFERLTGLRSGTLVPVNDVANRSLTLAEIEAIRALRAAFEVRGLGTPLFHRVVRMQVAAYMKTRRPDPAEPRIETPQWALDRAGEIARKSVVAIEASGVRIIGNLSGLTVVPAGRQVGDPEPERRGSPEIAASMAMGVLVAGGFVAGSGGQSSGAARAFAARPRLEPIELATVATADLGRMLARRLAGGAVRRATRWLPGRA